MALRGPRGVKKVKSGNNDNETCNLRLCGKSPSLPLVAGLQKSNENKSTNLAMLFSKEHIRIGFCIFSQDECLTVHYYDTQSILLAWFITKKKNNAILTDSSSLPNQLTFPLAAEVLPNSNETLLADALAHSQVRSWNLVILSLYMSVMSMMADVLPQSRLYGLYGRHRKSTLCSGRGIPRGSYTSPHLMLLQLIVVMIFIGDVSEITF